jgi:hypothetical protein
VAGENRFTESNSAFISSDMPGSKRQHVLGIDV